MNVIELLEADHEIVKELFEKVKATEDSEHRQIFTKIKTELDTHAHIEETLFYPRLLEDGNEELVEIVREGIEEHRQAKMFLRELDALSDDSDKFEAKLSVLMEDVEHHVEEEEGEMFPLVENQFDAAVLDELGALMEAEKKSFKQEAAGAAG